ncbi:JAB domain-containing protein [Exiguobacterium sp.]|nr:JAB domain-containing protein [Exiguobacterium sp.]
MQRRSSSVISTRAHMDIQLLDHLIVGGGEKYVSIKAQGIL